MDTILVLQKSTIPLSTYVLFEFREARTEEINPVK